MRLAVTVLASILLLGPVTPETRAQQAASAPAAADTQSVAGLMQASDRALLANLRAYVAAKPTADDLEQAYMVIFERAIENDWYLDNEELARRYLKEQPEGAVAPLARIVGTMARVRAGKFDEALGDFRLLMQGVNQPDQEEFASNFADSLAGAAASAGEVALARQTYEILLQQFGDSPILRQKVQDELDRLAMVGRPAPPVSAQTIDGAPVRLSDLRGKYVLVDFWATWCLPCVADLPKLTATYDQFHEKGLEIVAVSLDENPQAISDFVRARKVPWLQLHQGTCGEDLVAAFKVGSIPASFLIAPDGSVQRINLQGEALSDFLSEKLR